MDYYQERNVDYFSANTDSIRSLPPDVFENSNSQDWSCFICELQGLFEILFCFSTTNHISVTEKNIRTSIISPKTEERSSFYQSIKGLFPLVTTQDDLSTHEITTHVPNL